MEIGDSLPLVQENEHFYIAMVETEYAREKQQICAFPLIAQKARMPAAWVTRSGLMFFGYRTSSCDGELYLRDGEQLEVVGISDDAYRAVINRYDRSIPLTIPRDTAFLAYEPGPPPTPVPEGPRRTIIHATAETAKMTVVTGHAGRQQKEETGLKPEIHDRLADLFAADQQLKKKKAAQTQQKTKVITATNWNEPWFEVEDADSKAAARKKKPEPTPAPTVTETAQITPEPEPTVDAGPDDDSAPSSTTTVAAVQTAAATTVTATASAETAAEVTGKVEAVEQPSGKQAPRVSFMARLAGILAGHQLHIIIIMLFIIIIFVLLHVKRRLKVKKEKAPALQEDEATMAAEAEPLPLGSDASDTEVDMSGHIAASSLGDVAQFLNAGKETGVLGIKDEAGQEEGTMVFEKGELIDAQSPGHRGVEAVYDLLRHKEGFFSFVRHAEDSGWDRTINQGTISLLLDVYRVIDEEMSGMTGESGEETPGLSL
jgi:hypothetical protein